LPEWMNPLEPWTEWMNPLEPHLSG
jgi:hypothetical protein